MSLKARIEAVIYAAEEPVTLAQLASLFRDEALAGRAARVAPQAGAAAPTEDEAEAAVDDLLPATEDAVQDAAQPSETAPRNSADAEVATPDFAGQPQPVPEPPGPATNPSPSGQREAQSPESGGSESAQDVEKKAARQRDREIREEIRAVIDELIAEYNSPDRGLEIREVAGGFRIGTRPEVHYSVRAFIKTLKPPLKLSLQALETLAVIAYKQPVTAPEIGEIRGVGSGGVLGSLVARKLITTAGRKQVIGRPILYKTTREFLLRFGLKDLNELPSIEEFEKMAADLEASEAESDSLATEEELPFAQNEIAEVEENSPEEDSPRNLEASSPSARGPWDPKEPAPPMNDPEPEVPEPPIGEPPTEPEPSPTSEQDVAVEEHQS
jgi:segregation and condensation protein B